MEKDYLVRFDFAIKKLLRNKANFAILEGFIEVFLGKKCKIQEILESESNQDFSDDKFNRVDIKAKDINGEIFIVEVQTTRYTYYLERILYGVSFAITEQIGNGKRYGVIKQVYSISIVYYDLGEGDDYFYECKSDLIGVHTHNPLQLSRREELTVEQIMQIKEETGKKQKYTYKKITSGDIFPRYFLIRINAFRKVVADAMDEWMDFLKNNSIKPDTSVPGLKEAKEQLRYSKMTDEERYNYDRHIESLSNEEEAICEARIEGQEEGEAKGLAKGLAKGREEGREEGVKQEKIAIARAMKQHGDDIDYIAAITGLTLNEISKL